LGLVLLEPRNRLTLHRKLEVAAEPLEGNKIQDCLIGRLHPFVTKLGQPVVRETVGTASLDSLLAVGAQGVGLTLEATSIES
jgi:hypothetical protein